MRNVDFDMASEKEAIEQSMRAHGERQDEDVTVRASTITEAENVLGAFDLAEARIDEALDVLTAINPTRGLSSYRLLEAGCARDLNTGQIIPRMPKAKFGTFPAFLIEPAQYPPRDLAQYVLSTDRGDLGVRYVRAAHWSRKAEFEFNTHLAMLFEWFVTESIWSLKRDDDVIPSIRWSLSFVGGQGAQLLSATTLGAIKNDTQYRPWSRHVDALLERIRTIRNQTVHNGFRMIDVPPAELAVLGNLARLAARGAQGTVAQGIVAGIMSAADLVEYLPLLMEPILLSTSRNVIKIMTEAGVAPRT